MSRSNVFLDICFEKLIVSMSARLSHRHLNETSTQPGKSTHSSNENGLTELLRMSHRIVGGTVPQESDIKTSTPDSIS